MTTVARTEPVRRPNLGTREQRIERLRAAGLNLAAARKVAAHTRGGPVVLGPGVIVSLFALDANDEEQQHEARPC